MSQGKREDAEEVKAKVAEMAKELVETEAREEPLQDEIRKIMLVLPNIIDETVPLGKNDAENVEQYRVGEAFVPDFEIPYHIDIMESLNGVDLESARKTSGNGFYFLQWSGRCS